MDTDLRPIEIPTAGLSYPEWQELRNSTPGIGGSEAAAVCGLDDYVSPLQLWYEKTGRIGARTENEPMLWGHLLEDIVADEFARRTGWTVTKPDAMFLHPTRRWQLGNPDRFVYHPTRGLGLLEVKTASFYQGDEWRGDIVPDRAALQGHHYCEVLEPLDIRWFAAAVLIAGQQFRYLIVDHDPEIGHALTEIEERFWVDHVLADVPPPVTGSDGCTDFAKALWGDVVYEDVVALPSEASDLLLAREELSASIKDLEERKAAIDNQFRQWLGLHPAGVFADGRRVTYKAYDGETFDEAGFAKAHPGLHSEWTAPSKSRRFYFPRPPKPKKGSI